MAEAVDEAKLVKCCVLDEVQGLLYAGSATAAEGQFRVEVCGFDRVGLEKRDGQKRDILKMSEGLP